MPQSYEPFKVSSTAVVEVERETLFWIDDVEYTIPTEIPAGAVAGFLDDLATMSEYQALGRVLADVLPEGALADLRDCEDFTDANMTQLMAIINDKLSGAMEGMAGKSNRAQRRSRG